MSAILKRINTRNHQVESIAFILLAFCVVALSFFAIGVVYAKSFETAVLAKLLVIVGSANIALVFYVIKKLQANPAATK